MASSQVKVSPVVTKSISQTGVSIPANDIVTLTLNVSDAVYHMIKGFSISGTTNVVIMQCYFANDTQIQVRCRNLVNAANSFAISVHYC